MKSVFPYLWFRADTYVRTYVSKQQSPHFIKSRDAVATALAAGNRRLKAIELKPIEEALNPILIRTKQRQNSENFSTNKKSARGIDPVLPSLGNVENKSSKFVLSLHKRFFYKIVKKSDF